MKECNTLVRSNKIPIEMDHVPVLLHLYYSPEGCSQQKISLDLQRDKASINRTVNFLSKIEMVNIEKSLVDKRATLVELTPLGIEIAEKMLALLKEFDQSFAAALNMDEQAQLIGLLNKLIG
ncbi:MAG: hypothetical protein EOO20_06360 [Chryseobacterium sp.]|nr:MAG: hypothetical protein EOO20_06360 [Chryseobacterium sp.]